MYLTNEKVKELSGNNLYDHICRYAREYGDEVFLLDERESFTWKRAKAAVENLAGFLTEYGVKRGDFIAVLGSRKKEMALIRPAFEYVGAAAVMCDAHYTAKDALKKSGADLAVSFYFTDEDSESANLWTLKDSSYKTVASIAVGEIGQYAAPAYVKDMDAPALVILTSGSTGKSKAVVLSARNYITPAVGGGNLFEEKRGDVSVLVLPCHHVFGQILLTYATVNGHAVFVPEKVDYEYVAECIEKYRITVFYGVPTFFLSMLALGADKKHDLSSLRFALVSGGPSTGEQMRFIEERIGCILVPVYGMSECVGISTVPVSAPASERFAGVGRFFPACEGFIVDGKGNVLGANEEGEICARAQTNMLGYLSGGKLDRSSIDSEGRLHTGDLGYVDENGILHITGRIKDLIIRAGENISAGKIERALLSLGGVYNAAAVAIPDEMFGEVPAAAVVLTREAPPLSEDELKCALKGKLGKHEIPVKIAVVESFPLTSSGKTDKQRLKELLK